MPSPIALRRLLASLRDLMAGLGSAQERLNRLVCLIAQGMEAEVCSTYVLRPGEVLELFATCGLHPDAVHKTRLRVGEGLVGTIAASARPLALVDAQHHPKFVYRPETGEEIFHSLMGVPVIRGGKVIGVLVVQHKKKRSYHEEETETLETIATILAELVAGGELIPKDELRAIDGNALLPLRLEGVKLNSGIGVGIAVLHLPRIHIERLVAEDTASEIKRLKRAINEMHSSIDAMLANPAIEGDGEHRDILETYRMFANDKGWLTKITEAVKAGLTAEAAVQRIREENQARMGQISDPYLRERLHDLNDLANRLLQHLTGNANTAASQDLPDNAIIIANSMGPAELLDYDRKKLKGIALEEGSPSSHVAIIARALDIPVIGRLDNLLSRIEPGDPAIIDGDHAVLYVRPGEDIIDAFSENLRWRALRAAAFAAQKDLPSETLCGEFVELNINAGLLADLHYLHETGAHGVGLYRTEIPFLARSNQPDLETQAQLYRKILEDAAGKPVNFRTLDVGGDKVLPYWQGIAEENPAMGWRSVRITLDHPALMRQQLRALIRAGAGYDLRIMFPMISEVAEFDRAKAILDMELERAEKRHQEMPRSIKVGAVLEVPALGFQLNCLLSRLDFISLGSNDFLQFFFAADRGNPRIAERYDPLSPPVIAFLNDFVRKCQSHDVPFSICGEMGGRPLEAMILIGLGFRSLSMSGPAIGSVKNMLMSLKIPVLKECLGRLQGYSGHSLRNTLKAFAVDHDVII